MYAEIVAAVQGTKTLVDLIKTAHSMSNYSEVLTAVTTVQQKLTEAIASVLESQEKQAILTERVRELERQLAEAENWKSQLQRYSLFQFETKTFAYALKSELGTDEPHHYICATCVENKRRSILQYQSCFLYCPLCNTKIQMYTRPSII